MIIDLIVIAMLKKIQDIYKKLRSDKKKEFNLALSFGDYFTDRCEKAKFLGFGKGSSIYDNVLVLGDVEVGENTWIGPNVILDGSGGLKIGSGTAIGAGVQVYSHDTIKRTLSAGEKPIETAPTFIGDHTQICPNVVILKGVRIGDRVVVGAASLVNKDVPDDTVVAGTPAKFIKKSDI